MSKTDFQCIYDSIILGLGTVGEVEELNDTELKLNIQGHQFKVSLEEIEAN